jgi:hypothetical protein
MCAIVRRIVRPFISWSDTKPAPTVAGTPSYLQNVAKRTAAGETCGTQGREPADHRSARARRAEHEARAGVDYRGLRRSTLQCRLSKIACRRIHAAPSKCSALAATPSPFVSPEAGRFDTRSTASVSARLSLSLTVGAGCTRASSPHLGGPKSLCRILALAVLAVPNELPSRAVGIAAAPSKWPARRLRRPSRAPANGPSSGRHGGLPQTAIGLLEQLKGDNRPPFRQQSASPFRGRFAMLREREVDAPQGGVVFLHRHVR